MYISFQFFLGEHVKIESDMTKHWLIKPYTLSKTYMQRQTQIRMAKFQIKNRVSEASDVFHSSTSTWPHIFKLNPLNLHLTLS